MKLCDLAANCVCGWKTGDKDKKYWTHITRIANKLIHLAHNQSHIVEHLQPEDVSECGFGYELTE
jgi:hypothetical protein